MERHPGSVESTGAALSDVNAVTPAKASRRPPTRLEFLIDSAIDAIQARRAEHNQRVPSPPAAASHAEPVPAFAYSEAVAPRHVQEPLPGLPEPLPLPEAEAEGVNMTAIAQLCTRLACAQDAQEVTGSLEEAANLLNAVGLILWIPDSLGVVLTPVFAHGYPDEVIAVLARVSTDANNASAQAFRTLTTCIVNGSEYRTGAIVAPLLTPMGCAGVLAVELHNGDEQRDDVRAAITILAAQMSTLMGFSVLAHTMSA
jgi:hypothetical protein